MNSSQIHRGHGTALPKEVVEMIPRDMKADLLDLMVLEGAKYLLRALRRFVRRYPDLCTDDQVGLLNTIAVYVSRRNSTGIA